MIDRSNIKNLILDLGGVILELDVEKTIQGFLDFGFPELGKLDIVMSAYPFFLEFETGKISAGEFRQGIRLATGKDVPDAIIDSAWNAMICGFKKDTVDLLLQVKNKYRLILLSNTNEIHETTCNNQLYQEHGIANLDRIFDTVYYSHKLGMRKPSVEIFEYVVREQGLVPEETFYIDDTLAHLETANKLGIQAFYLEPPQRIVDLLL